MTILPVDVYVSGRRHDTFDLHLPAGAPPLSAAVGAAAAIGYAGVEALACDAHRITVRADAAPTEEPARA